MPGSYLGFPIFKETTQGAPEPVGSGVEVKVRIEGELADAAESPLLTDANGEITAGSIAAASPGDVALFRIDDLDGLSATVAQTLT